MDILLSTQEKYKSNPYMTHKLEQYVQQIPMVMKTIEDDYIKKCKRQQELREIKDMFLFLFMSTHSYYYIPQTEIYVGYDQLNYQIVSEDDIAHEIMEKIRENKTILNWKFKMMSQIFKHIKELPISNAVPTSSTETSVFLSLSTYFKTECHVRYVLILLGDLLLNKKDNLIYFMDPSYKSFIQQISQQVYAMTNKTFDIIKYKYYDHKYEQCRIITGVCPSTLPKLNILNIITVAIHLSQQYQTAEQLLDNLDPAFVKSVNCLKNKTPTGLVQYFLKDCTTSSTQSLSFKDIYFLWRTFLKTHTLPFVISQSNMKVQLTEMGIYDPVTDTCPNITSKFNSSWIHFKHFWDKYMTVTDDDDHMYDLTEIVQMYHSKTEKQYYITEEVLKEILEFEYPNIMVTNRQVFNVTCSLWNKPEDIDTTMTIYRYQDEHPEDINVMYDFYRGHKKNTFEVSRSYFQRYLS